MGTKNKIAKHYKDFFDLHAKGFHLTEDDHLNLDWAEALVEDLTNEKTQQQTELIERLKLCLKNIINNPKELHSGGCYELDVPMEEITVAESLIEETKK